jgi:hypothetical protein
MNETALWLFRADYGCFYNNAMIWSLIGETRTQITINHVLNSPTYNQIANPSTPAAAALISPN